MSEFVIENTLGKHGRDRYYASKGVRDLGGMFLPALGSPLAKATRFPTEQAAQQVMLCWPIFASGGCEVVSLEDAEKRVRKLELRARKRKRKRNR